MAALVPSTMPISVSFSSSSRELKVVTVVTRAPRAVSVNWKSICMVGMSELGTPSSSAKPSFTTKLYGASTLTHSQ